MRSRGAGGGNPIQNIRDMGAQLGGPIMTNKAWFWGAMSRQDVRVGVLGFYDTAKSGCQAVATVGSSAKNPDGSFVNSIDGIKDCLFGDITTLKNNNARLQYQEATGHQTEFSYTYGDKYRGSRGCDAFHPLITCSMQTGPTVFYTGDHRWIVEQPADDHRPVHAHPRGLVPRLRRAGPGRRAGDQLGGHDLLGSQQVERVVPHDSAAGRHPRGRQLLRLEHAGRRSLDQVRLRLSPVAGGIAQHGRRRRASPATAASTVPPGAYNTDAGHDGGRLRHQQGRRARSTACPTRPARRRAATKPTSSAMRTSPTSCISATLYVQDSIKKGRATINLGLRFDHQHDIATPGTVPANRILPAQLPAINFPGADSGVALQQLVAARRLHLRPDAATARPSRRLSASRYYGIGMFTAQALEPTGTTTTLRFPWKDLNGDKVVQANELQVFKADGTTLNLLNSPAGYDPDQPGLASHAPSIVDPNMTQRHDRAK